MVLRHSVNQQRRNHEEVAAILPPAQRLTLFLLAILVAIPEISRFWRFQQEQNASLQRPNEQPQEAAVEVERKEQAGVSEKDRPTITELFQASGTDKLSRHHYDRYYKHWLAPYRDKPEMTMLEIGADQGKSLKTWQDYFSDPKLIVGLAYGSPSAGVEGKTESLARVRVVRGDQSKKETMDELIQLGPWDIILDDGSHHPDHIIFSLWSLWTSVKPGGLYIIEDLEGSYFKAGSTLYDYVFEGGINAGPKTNAVAKLKQFVEIMQRHHIGEPQLSIMPGDEWICSMEFGMNLVVLRKCTQQDLDEAPKRIEAFHRDPEEVAQWLDNAKASNPTALV